MRHNQPSTSEVRTSRHQGELVVVLHDVLDRRRQYNTNAVCLPGFCDYIPYYRRGCLACAPERASIIQLLSV